MKKFALILTILSVLSLVLFVAIFFVERKIRIRLPEILVEVPFVPAKIFVDPNKEVGNLPTIWRAFGQGGEEQGKQMLAPTVNFLKRIKPAYIRLDHIYDDDYYGVVSCSGNNLNLNWSNLDRTINDILAAGAKPFFSLSYMPSCLASSKIGVPDWGKWQALVRATVEHYSGRSGKNISGVYYEVWNEPSLPMFGNWKMYGGKDYRQLYHYAVLGASQAKNINPFKIGGPAIPELDPKWIKLLYDYVLEKNLRLDFISWHRYSFQPEQFVADVEEVDVLNTDPKYQRFSRVERVITEWGPNSYKDVVYSGKVAASHAVATLSKILNKVNWAFAFEIKDGPGQGEEGWGLLTHESVGIREKPRFYLFDWLADFDGRRVFMSGEGSRIKGWAQKKDRTVLVILANYSPSNCKTETFPVTFSSLGGGTYRFSQQELFKKPVEQEVKIGSGDWTQNITLPAYSVIRLRLTKLAGLSKPALGQETTGFAKLIYTYYSEGEKF